LPKIANLGFDCNWPSIGFLNENIWPSAFLKDSSDILRTKRPFPAELL
jgi:hypothetical protein